MRHESLQDQLGKVQKQMQGKRELEQLFSAGGISADPTRSNVDWDAIFKKEIEAVLGNMADAAKANAEESRAKTKALHSETYMNYAIGGCLATLGASVLYMLAQNCTNSDKGPKFKV